MPRTPNSRAEQLATEIERDILDTRPQPGERLGFRTELIERYGVSPSVMNEALQILRERGRVLVKRGATGGIFVNDIPPQLRIGVVDIWFDGLADARHLFEARRSLEDLLSETALHRATPEDVQMMAWALDELHGSRDDPKLFFGAILRFHIAIARAARIPYVSDLYATLSTLLANTIVKARFIEDHERPADQSVVVHGRLLEAIKSRDPDALRRACRVHNEMELRETHLAPHTPENDEQLKLATQEAEQPL
ncbi:FCD domain-containing protein [Nocardia sp. NPDC050799]|uniref:FadR/GntR family transcriptional regulator n=1 Tax=Nocardia TaxID=1817 RepID=UPI0007A755BF|nr:FCD domain-containing protein [Nocardia fusca]